MKTLVSTCSRRTRNIDPNIRNCGGLVTEGHTIWVASQGNGLDILPNARQYNHSGQPLIDPLIYIIPLDVGVLSSAQIITLSDLFWLRKGVLAATVGTVASVPKISSTAPAIGTVANQPTADQIALEQFYNPPNGYFGGTININISALIQFCILHPEHLTTPEGLIFNTLLQQAHNIYLPLSLNPTNQSLKLSYATALQIAQNNIPLLGLNFSSSTTVNQLITSPLKTKSASISSTAKSTSITTTSIILNPSKGFVFVSPPPISQKASSHLVATRADTFIYVYAPLINVPGLQAVIANVSGVDKHAVYTSVAIINDQLYATDMANRSIDVFDFNFDYLFDLS